jgi:glycosyltransferase involved in cell wall biosynthesis
VAVSDSAAQNLIALGINERKVSVVHNGVNIGDFSETREAARQYTCRIAGIPDAVDITIVISVGQFGARKNQLDTLKVMSHLIKTKPRIHLLLLGDLSVHAAYTQHILEYIEEKELSDSVHVLGFRQDVKLLLQGSDILIHTALSDPHPRVVLEAMAASLPVVAYSTDGVAETVAPGITGLLSPLGDITSMVSAINCLIENRNIRLDMGIKGNQRIRQLFTAEATAEKISQKIAASLHHK